MAARKTCVLCGKQRATTNDHLPPKSIYPKPRPVDLFTVPACKQCNEGDSKADEVFKMVVCFETGEVRENSDDVASTLARTIGYNPRIANDVFSSQKRMFVDRGSGILQPEYKLEFDFDPYETVVQRMLRGLFWRETGEIASPDDHFTVIPAHQMDSKLSALFRKLLPQLETRQLNCDSVRYKFHLQDTSSFWGINIFVRHNVFAIGEHRSKTDAEDTTAG